MYAIADGTVTEVRESATFGNLVKYNTKDGLTVMYAHLSKSLVIEGEPVKQGETVALSGNTGLSTGAHLHLSVWESDLLIDPLAIFRPKTP